MTMTTANIIKEKYFNDNSFVEVVESMPINGIDCSKAFDNAFGFKRVRFNDGSMLRIFEAFYPSFCKKMEEIKKAAAAKKTAAAKAADTKENRYLYIQRYITVFSVDAENVDICLLDEAVIKYPDRNDFEEAIARILG